jgi:hypothetical protein
MFSWITIFPKITIYTRDRRELRSFSVRGFISTGVESKITRGQGKIQQKSKKFTEAKILAFLLQLGPLNYEGLRDTSKIQRNILRIRLDSLVMRGMITKHKYNGPKIVKGGPRVGDFYYILNRDNHEIKPLIDYYYSQPSPKLKVKEAERQATSVDLNRRIDLVQQKPTDNEKHLLAPEQGILYKKLMSIERRIELKYEKSLQAHSEMAECISKLRELGYYDPIEDIDESNSSAIVDIKTSVVTETIAETIVKLMLQRGATEDEIRYVYENLPNKYKHFSEQEWSNRRKILGTFL